MATPKKQESKLNRLTRKLYLDAMPTLENGIDKNRGYFSNYSTATGLLITCKTCDSLFITTGTASAYLYNYSNKPRKISQYRQFNRLICDVCRKEKDLQSELKRFEWAKEDLVQAKKEVTIAKSAQDKLYIKLLKKNAKKEEKAGR